MSKKILSVFLFLLLPLVFLVHCQLEDTEKQNSAISRAASSEIQREEKIYSNATIEDDFDGSSVIVVMDKKTGGMNKRHDPSFFRSFEKEYVEDLTEVTVDPKDSLIDWEKFHQILMIKLPQDSKENVLDVIQQLEKTEGVLYAGPNYFWYPGAVPDDTYYGSQWGLGGPQGIKAPDAWDITLGSNDVRVGIIDTGIAPHPDLNANLVAGRNFVAGDNENDTGDTGPHAGHGTHVAGIVGAVGNNYTGISGVCWNVKLVPLKISGTTPGTGTTTAYVINAIKYAGINYIPILNFSWWGFGNDQGFRNAIANYSGLFVCIAGNGTNGVNSIGKDNDKAREYPADWTATRSGYPALTNLISVGSIDSNGSRSSFSNWGATTVDLFAPGGDIYSTSYTGSYVYMSGTSMAAPHVAGVAALVKSLHPWMTGAELKIALRNSVDPLSQSGLCSTNGKINAYTAVNHIPIVGSMNINFNYYAPAEIHLGKFHLFMNGTWALVEMAGVLLYPIDNLQAIDIPVYVKWDPVPAAITNYLRQAGIGTMYPPVIYQVYVPLSNSNNFGNGYWINPVTSTITSTSSTVVNEGGRFYMYETLPPNVPRKVRIRDAYGEL
jgi:hypothetical protein